MNGNPVFDLCRLKVGILMLSDGIWICFFKIESFFICCKKY
ncbi:hypothetical protein NEIPOLOT_01365 [Neisseria polysaccharea ATCC 43768]|nr:hypothetical protein NEIPOLOT_01365 [Neisseria polysaccharea ATCC 43768]